MYPTHFYHLHFVLLHPLLFAVFDGVVPARAFISHPYDCYAVTIAYLSCGSEWTVAVSAVQLIRFLASRINILPRTIKRSVIFTSSVCRCFQFGYPALTISLAPEPA
jgi:hypothetical protein